MRYRTPALLPIVLLALSPALAAQSPDEDQARRQLESGRSFARQGNFTEALRDFRVVAETYASTSVADNALLEIARYFIDIVDDPKEATAAVETILKRYPTSDSAPDAYLITGRLAMLRSHQSADLDTALANFDRVFRLFPSADAVPHSLVLAGEAHWLAGRYDDALASLVRAEVEYPSTPITARAHLQAAQVLISRGDPIGAMEELQQVRNRWPASKEAATALGRLTMLHRLYVRAKNGVVYSPTTETAGPARLQNLVGLATTAQGAIYWAAQSGFGLVTPEPAPAPPTGGPRPRGLVTDRLGHPVVVEQGGLRPFTGEFLSLLFPRPSGPPVALEKIDGAAQLYGGDWVVADEDVRGIQRFSRAGEHLGQFSLVRATRLAVNALDEVAAVDRDQRGVAVFDVTGNQIGRIPAKGTGYELRDIEALAFDAFGHLYVLDRTALAIFTPYSAAPAGPASPAKPAVAASRNYTLLALYAEPEKSPGAFRRATAFALDASGGLFLYDERAQRVQVYR